MLQSAVRIRFLKRCTSGRAHRVVHAVDTDTVCAMCRCLSRHWSLTFCTLNSIKFCTHQWMCTCSYTQAFPFFCVCTDFRVYSGVGVVGVQPRRHEGKRQTWRALQLIARLCETCMHRTSTLVLGIGVAFARSNSWNGLVGVSLLPKSLPFHRSCHAQRLFFPRSPLVSEPLTYTSPADEKRSAWTCWVSGVKFNHGSTSSRYVRT